MEHMNFKDMSIEKLKFMEINISSYLIAVQDTQGLIKDLFENIYNSLTKQLDEIHQSMKDKS